MKSYILVVDDEQDIREFLKDLLEDQGYEIALAEDGHKAMDSIKNRIPDLILLDLLMPEETGTGLFRRIHDKKEYKNIPVIVISGMAGRGVAVSKTVPVFDKPIDEQGLLKTILEILG